MIVSERNILLKIAYDGTNFCGWQRQPNARTVCGELEELLTDLTGCPVKLDGTSRTDAGVHALGQQASFKAVFGIPTERLARVMNDCLAKDRLEGVGEIRILEAREMPAGFHARFSSRGKRYIYKMSCAPEPDIFKRNYCYQVCKPLDIEAMRKAAQYILGKHDFKCFQSMGSTPRESTVREIYQLDITQDGTDIQLAIAGNGFLYNMVRIITGTLVEVGLGKRAAESVEETVASLERGKAGHTAPPQGLYLQEVFY